MSERGGVEGGGDYDDEVLPEQTSDDTDRGWGDERTSRTGEDPDIERLLREKPPHW